MGSKMPAHSITYLSPTFRNAAKLLQMSRRHACFSGSIITTLYKHTSKVMVVEMMRKERLIYCEAARQLGVPSDTRVASWERIYLTEGAEGSGTARASLCSQLYAERSSTQTGQASKVYPMSRTF
ncbi:hypothetical protein LY28_03653 [Ruminiclostridium sufflavum DSM 19573]|uniref:Helix-turn-helix protein n=1 Tax=Ruminiclostridium sufflavum DSM 19573 TaxID=1121337 RepID=A0A318XH96_9FIRM|nr:hypothetical protein LY28_03653 [Ruminiclostridium sufflavum DSM 19573]